MLPQGNRYIPLTPMFVSLISSLGAGNKNDVYQFYLGEVKRFL
jgi:hypothetical protein